MTPDDYARLKQLVAGALSRPAADREDYLIERCAGDTALRVEAQSLLAAAVRAERLYEDPAFVVDGQALELDAFADVPEITLSFVEALPVPLTPVDDHFEGTERYVVRRRIGAGGMGIVYEAHDRVHDRVVALKTLRSRSGDDVYQLKREFRNLADVAHPNLVSLYELVITDEQCFFTMELVAGEHFVDYVRRGERVRAAVAQLVEGVLALHRRGLLHRDIKPSNVLVTADGRVVILDFGLTSARLRAGLVGTPAYLSPEQCEDREVSFASDWYSVGATLYHAFSGRPPFDGSIPDVLERKTTQDPPSIAELAPDTPDELAALCMSLLQRDPGARPSGQQVLDRLSLAGVPHHGDQRNPSGAVFVGRESSRKVLSQALASARAGGSVSVVVHGPSGIGKSALVQVFIDDASRQGTVLLLRGRCHEHESIPYNGIDGIVDDLTRYLAALPASELAGMLPAGVAALVRLFPVLRALGIEPEAAGADPIEIWRKAFSAFRDLLARVAARHPILIDIDDFHWADADTVKWLNTLLRPPAVPSLMVVIAFRSEELDAKPFLRGLVERIDIGERHSLPLMPLSGDEVSQLIGALAPDASVASSPAEFVNSSGGNPFLVDALARHTALGFRGTTGVTLDEMLIRRLDHLPPESRAFLETLALCGRPVLPSRIFEACGLHGDERALVARLKAAHLLRSSRVADRVELYHDRIRQAIAAWVSPEVARHRHEAMALALIAAGDDDAEGLFEHYRAAGRYEQAAAHAAAAAEQASAVLAFDLAATFYRHALELHPGAGSHATWSAGLARALENAGRPAEAADMYLSAARHGSGRDQLEWQRKAAELLLVGGQIDRGLAVSAEVLRSIGMRLDRGPRSAVISIALRRLQLRWRGLGFEHRDASTIPADDLLRIDASWSISAGLAMVDPVRAAAFSVRQLLKALEVGDPGRVARALAVEAGFSVVSLGSGAERAAVFSRRAESLAPPDGLPHVNALTLLALGIAALLTGRWQKAAEACGQAVVTLRDDCTGVLWELNLAQVFFLGSLMWQGEIREVAQHLPGLIETARDRGNFYLELELRTRMVLVWLAADQPDAAEQMADEGIARWSHRGFQRQHFNHLICRVQIELYRGRPHAAWQLMSEHDERLRRSLLHRVQHTRIEAANYHARSALAMAAAGEDARRMRAIALRDADRIVREGMPWSNPFARIVWAAVAHQEGDAHKAVAELTKAVAAFESQGMALYAAACRRRLGQLIGGAAGQVQLNTAERWMASQEIRDPLAMTRMVAPGFP